MWMKRRLTARSMRATRIRYSLATDMARDAVMTALEGAGIDVEMATPEMVEDVLRARDAEFMSAKKRRALETVSSQDEYQQTVVSSADGAKVLKNLDSLAKEYQENVLSGNFNEVTLQKINQYIDETTPRNPYGRRLSQRLPQRVEREMYESQRENAVDALYSRISESSVPANGRFSESGRREIESRKKEALKGWAIATGNWHTDLSAFTNQTEPIGVRTDSKVYVSKDGKHVIKASKGKPYGKRFCPDIDNIPLFKNVCVVCADERQCRCRSRGYLHIRQRQEQFVYSYGGESQRSHQVCIGRCHGIDSEHHAVGYLAG